MKLFELLCISLVFIICPKIVGCPTCVGRIKPESPPFFSTDFYQPGQAISRQTKEQFAQNELKKLVESTKGKK